MFGGREQRSGLQGPTPAKCLWSWALARLDLWVQCADPGSLVLCVFLETPRGPMGFPTVPSVVGSDPRKALVIPTNSFMFPNS